MELTTWCPIDGTKYSKTISRINFLAIGSMLMGLALAIFSAGAGLSSLLSGLEFAAGFPNFLPLGAVLILLGLVARVILQLNADSKPVRMNVTSLSWEVAQEFYNQDLQYIDSLKFGDRTTEVSEPRPQPDAITRTRHAYHIVVKHGVLPGKFYEFEVDEAVWMIAQHGKEVVVHRDPIGRFCKIAI